MVHLVSHIFAGVIQLVGTQGLEQRRAVGVLEVVDGRELLDQLLQQLRARPRDPVVPDQGRILNCNVKRDLNNLKQKNAKI